MVILNFLTTTSNLTSNFETHKNVRDIFLSIYIIFYIHVLYTHKV